jgi:hypothetical protein
MSFAFFADQILKLKSMVGSHSHRRLALARFWHSNSSIALYRLEKEQKMIFVQQRRRSEGCHWHGKGEDGQCRQDSEVKGYYTQQRRRSEGCHWRNTGRDTGIRRLEKCRGKASRKVTRGEVQDEDPGPGPGPVGLNACKKTGLLPLLGIGRI